jgi:hypothetical protein
LGGGGGGGIRRRNGSIGNRVKEALGAAKEFPNDGFGVIRFRQETGLETKPSNRKRTAKEVGGGTGESVGVRSVGEIAPGPVSKRSRDYVRRTW